MLLINYFNCALTL